MTGSRLLAGTVLALLATGRWRFAELGRQWLPLAGHAVLFALLALPWFFVVRAVSVTGRRGVSDVSKPLGRRGVPGRKS